MKVVLLEDVKKVGKKGGVDFAVVLEPFKVEKYDHLKLP